MKRRTFLQHVGALGVAAGRPAGAPAQGKADDPAARPDLTVIDVPYRNNNSGRPRMAT